MMKKSVLIVFILISFLIISNISNLCLVLAQETDEEKVAKAYDWLSDKVRGKWATLTTEQHAFSLLAFSCNNSHVSQGKSSLYNKAFNFATQRCWGGGPSRTTSGGSCLLKETALAKVALDVIGEDTEKESNWLLSRNMTQTTGIEWYLQIDVERDYDANCSVIYAGQDEKKLFKINDDKTVGFLDSDKCFPSVYPDIQEGYWFKIRQSGECYSNTYTIKCYSDAPTVRVALLYRKSNSDVWHVSSETKSGKPGIPDSTRLEDRPDHLELEVQSYCLANPDGVCDYEGTAWATYVLDRQGKEDANLFVPYLVVFADTNVKYFPESFLYPLTGQERYSDNILVVQQIIGIDKGYWHIQPFEYGRVYDTAHAALALTGGEAVTKAKNYLLENQEANGDLNAYNDYGEDSVRDTAFALWTLWPNLCPGIPTLECEAQGPDFTCKETTEGCGADEIEMPEFICPADMVCCKWIGGGDIECADVNGICREFCEEDEFEILAIICPDWESCCKPYADAYCDDVDGEICKEDEECSGTSVYTLDGDCCLGSCISTDVSDKDCIDVGIECYINQVCINFLTWDEVGFTITADSDLCCIGETVKCITDETCYEIGGEECSLSEECVGTIEESSDIEECCVGECLERCVAQEGTICTGDEKCSVNYIDASDTYMCCPSHGECKKPVGLWWIWLIIIAIVAGAALYFFKFRKKRIKKKILFPGFRQTGLPARPTIRPKPVLRPGIPIRRAARPIARARPMPVPRPIAVKKIKKGKAEGELEKTLKKLKKMTKK